MLMAKDASSLIKVPLAKGETVTAEMARQRSK